MRRRSALGAAALLVSSVLAVAVGVAAPAAAAEPPAGFVDLAVAGFDRPTAVEWLPDSTIVVLEQHTGRVRIGDPGGPFTTALDLAVCQANEQGLLGFVHDPAFLSNGFVYVFYTTSANGRCGNRVSRFQMVNRTIAPASEVILLDDMAAFTGTNHNGGDLDIDAAGNLLVAVGDGGSDPRGDSGSAGRNDAAQDLSILNGKILRITRGGFPAPGNPFTGPGTTRCATAGLNVPTSLRCQEIYAWGLRNPYRIAVDRNRGDARFFVNDVGQGTQEEVNLGAAGANYGWPQREGNCPQGRTPPCAGPSAGQTDPLTSYTRSRGTFITAGAFVPNGLWPAKYDGAYLFADGGVGRVYLRTAGGGVDYDVPFATGAFGLADMTFGFDTDGVMVLYYTQNGGGLRMIKPTGVAAAPNATNLRLQTVTPFRGYDTGPDGIGGAGVGDVFNGTTRHVDLDPPSGTFAALVNLTYDATAGGGFVRTWPARTARPATSALNADRAGTIAANAAVVALAADGSFVLESSTTARVVVDVLGWYRTTSGTAAGGRYVALDPLRLADTRVDTGQLLDSGSRNPYTRSANRIDVDVLGQLDVPDDGTVAAVVVGAAVIGLPDRAGFVGGHAGGTQWTGTSNANVSAGEIRANLMVVPVGSNGGISLRTFQVDDVALDLLGYVTSSAAPNRAAGLYNTIAPTRTVDSRIPLGFPRLAREAAARVAVPSAARGAAAVAQNVTATNTAGPLFVSAHPGPVRPEVSSVNADGPNQTRAAFAFTTVDADAEFFTANDATDLVVDVVGWFTP